MQLFPAEDFLQKSKAPAKGWSKANQHTRTELHGLRENLEAHGMTADRIRVVADSFVSPESLLAELAAGLTAAEIEEIVTVWGGAANFDDFFTYAKTHLAKIRTLLGFGYTWQIAKKLHAGNVVDAKFFNALRYFKNANLGGNLAAYDDPNLGAVSINGTHFITDHTYNNCTKARLQARETEAKPTTFWPQNYTVADVQNQLNQAIANFPDRAGAIASTTGNTAYDRQESTAHGTIRLTVTPSPNASVGGFVRCMQFFPTAASPHEATFSVAETGILISLL